MAFEPTHRRGDIWTIDFGSRPADPEQAFLRPAVIVSDDHLHHPGLQLVIVVPGTTTRRDLPLHITATPDPRNGLDQATDFQVEQVRAVSTARLVRRLGQLDTEARLAIDEILTNVLSLGR